MKKDFEKVAREIKEKEGKEKKEKIYREKEVEEAETIPLPDQSKATILMLVEWIFNLLAKRLGDKWELNQDELDQLGSCYIALAEKHLPSAVKHFSVEVNALFWTGIIILKRVALK